MAQVLSNLPVGAKVKFGKYSVNGEIAQPITWLVVAKNHTSIPDYPSNSITLLTEKIIDFRAYDAREPNSSMIGRTDYGNNEYSVSNIDQWLNKDSSAGEWYVASHNADQPPNATYTNGNTAYVSRPGFLNSFTEQEKSIIMTTPIRVVTNSSGYEDISRKVFLPSISDIGLQDESDTVEGYIWEYFNNHSISVGTTEQAFTYSFSTAKPSGISGNWTYWCRTPIEGPGTNVRFAVSDGSFASTYAYSGTMGVRPALNLPSTILVSDDEDTDGHYSVVWNTPPSSPTTLTIPTIYGGKANTISWSSVTDPDGDSVTYQLECSYDGSTFTQIYSGASTAHSHLVTFGTIPMAYRVKATDSKGESSEYVTAAVAMVINNNSPVISGVDGSLGIRDAEFSQTYSITDSDSSEIIVTEAVDGEQIRSFVATLGSEYSLAVTGNTWLSLANGVHTMTISASDGIDTSVRTYTFTKSVTSLSIQTKNPMESSTMPTRISIQVTRNIPTDAIFKVEVCNNGFDSNPTWEDATSSVTGIAVHLFENTKKTSTKWGVLVRVTVNRNGGEGSCYVSAIGGNFE